MTVLVARLTGRNHWCSESRNLPHMNSGLRLLMKIAFWTVCVALMVQNHEIVLQAFQLAMEILARAFAVLATVLSYAAGEGAKLV